MAVLGQRRAIQCFAVALLGGCSLMGLGDGTTFTLYRSSPTDMRIHVATFDATAGEAYNRGNCEIARELFQAQPGVSVKYWCEKGRFRHE